MMKASFTYAHVRAPDHVLVRELGDEAVLLDIESEEYFGLDDIGAAMWKALTTTSSVEEAYNGLLEEFEVETTILHQDLNQFVDRLTTTRLLKAEDNQSG
jgi:hypothetical protein